MVSHWRACRLNTRNYAFKGHGATRRALLAAREQMTGERTAKVNALVALTRSVNLDIDAMT